AIEIEVVPTKIERERERFLAKTLAAIWLGADPDAEFGGTMHAADAVELHVADDGRIDGLADGEDDLARVFAKTVPPLLMGHQVAGPIGEVEPRRGDVIDPAKQRPEILRHQRANGDPARQQHDDLTAAERLHFALADGFGLRHVTAGAAA